MTIKVGDKIPSVTLKQATADGKIQDLSTDDFFAGKKVVLFAVPGAFTPLCSAQHLPGFVEKAKAIKGKGIDAIACLSVNDAFVMGAWAKDRSVGESVVMLADGSGDFTRAVGLELDATGAGLGVRAQRFALVAEDGVVKHLAIEKPMKFEVSSADAILDAL
jgi:peroxiredoxin